MNIIMFRTALKIWSLKIGQMSLITVVLLLLAWPPALAHNVTVFAWVDGDTVHVESKFSGGRKPVASPIEVFDTNGVLLLKGLTDENGEFSFKVPRKTTMKIVLSAGMGHRAEWTIPETELSATVEPSEPPPATAQTGAPQPSPPAAVEQTPNSGEGCLTAAELDAVLERRLQPVMKMLAEDRQQGPSVQDILGGIGMIFGLVGVAAYAKSRRRK